MSRDFMQSLRLLTRQKTFDFEAVAVAINQQIEAGLYPEMKLDTILTAEQCREAFSEDYLSLPPPPPSPMATISSNTDADFDVQKEMESVETFADALRFEEVLSQKNRVKRDAIFKRVLSHLGPIGNASGGETRDEEYSLPVDIAEAMQGHEWKREMAKIKAEDDERNRCEKLELGNLFFSSFSELH